jgi:hypothetical protein
VLNGTDKATELSESVVFQGPWANFKVSELERISSAACLKFAKLYEYPCLK